MGEIVLTEDQAKVLAGALRPVSIKGPDGAVLGYLHPVLTPQVAEDLKRRAKEGPWFTSEQVRSRLAVLEAEWQRTGSFDQEHMKALLAQLEEQDPPRPDTGAGRQ